MQRTLTSRLAQIVDEIRYESLPPSVIEKCKTCFLDFLAACYSGAESPTAKAGVSILAAMGKGRATLIGRREKATPLGSALFNGMIAHAEELDDAHRYASGLHLGATIFPAALALAGKGQIAGKKFMRAIVLGYEISSRICRAIDLAHRQRGFHSTGTVGPFGSCAASAVVLGLGSETLVHALGIAGSMGAGLFAFLEDGATVKHMHAGRASMDGLLAALLAKGGMTGPRTVLEAKEGFFRAYSNRANPDEILREVKDPYEISFAYHKIHSACGHSFPAIDAALALREEIQNRAGEVRQIEVKTYRQAAVLKGETPRSIHEARFSIPFLVGLALVRGRVSQREWVPETLRDSQVHKVASQVLVTEDPEIAAQFPRLRSAVLRAEMADGRMIERRIDSPLGMPDNPIGWKDIEEKFYVASEGILNSSTQKEIVHKIRELDGLKAVREITSLLGRS